MKQKKKLLGWQLGITLALLILLILTMFMPAIQYSGEIRKDIQDELSDVLKDQKLEEIHKKTDEIKEKLFDEDSLLGGLLGGAADIISDKIDDVVEEKVDEAVGKLSDDDVKKINDDIDEKEEKNGIKIRHITPARIMTRGLERLIISDDAKSDELEDYLGENHEDINSKYKTVRTLFIVIYSVALIALLIAIIGFAAGWSKYVSLITDLLLGIASTVLFAYLRFGVMEKIGRKVLELKFESIPDDLSMEPFNKLYSYGLMVAFIVSILIIIMAIIFMIVGKAEEVVDYGSDYGSADAFYNENGRYDSENSETAAFSNDVNYFDGNQAGPFGGQDPFGGDDDAIPVTSASVNIDPVIYPDPVPPLDPNPQGMIQFPGPDPNVLYAQPDNRPMGVVKCTKGILAGHVVKLPEDQKIVVGKSPSKTNLTIGNPSISNIHCSIRYNAAKNSYKVKDHSTNGTYANGKKLPKDTNVECPAGTVLSLADGANEITLG